MNDLVAKNEDPIDRSMGKNLSLVWLGTKSVYPETPPGRKKKIKALGSNRVFMLVGASGTPKKHRCFDLNDVLHH